MKLFALLLTLFATMSLTATAADAPGKEKARKGKLRHVVSFKFKEGTTDADIKKVEAAFRALPKQIKEIKDFEWGTNNSPEKLNKGYTHCWILTFNNEADRDIYLKHPDHQAFGGIVGPHIGEVYVIDFFAEK